MLVEDGGQGVQALAKLGEAFLELDGFGFVHFRVRSNPGSRVLESLVVSEHRLAGASNDGF
jgi:hypothetical protein